MKNMIFIPLLMCGSLNVAQSGTVPSLPFNEYLEPISWYQPSEYRKCVFNLLVSSKNYQFWMICMPSFSPEYAVLLEIQCQDNNAANTCHYYLHVNEATKSIAENLYQNLDTPNSKNKAPEIVKWECELPISAAVEISNTWGRVVRMTRYSKFTLTGFDGVSYDFYSNPDYYGSTWSPEEGPPAMMVELANALVDYVKASPVRRTQILSKCLKLTSNLNDFNYKTH